ncbi:hypothetical protein HLX74_23970, partial [Escherichia coli]|nr:hypothetical protein [Escherichia coli]
MQPLTLAHDKFDLAAIDAGSEPLGRKFESRLRRIARSVKEIHTAKPPERRTLITTGDKAQVKRLFAIGSR